MMTKRSRGLLMLGLALLAGMGAVFAAARWLGRQAGEAHRIVVAAADVGPGARLEPAMLRVVDWPRESVPPGAFTAEPALQGRVLKASLARGEPVIEAKLAPAGTKGGLSAVVVEGKRAMTVRVNDVIGVAGFALPGNYVDIMVNVNTGQAGAGAGTRGDQDKPISKIVLERILVLAVAQEANRDETRPKVVNAVTLEVTPAEAEKLDLARSVGALSLVLRNQVDPQAANTGGATKDSLLGRQVQPVVALAAPAPRPVRPAATRAAVPARAEPRHCIEVIRGTQRQQECF